MRLVKVTIKTEKLAIIKLEYRHHWLWRLIFQKPKKVSYIGHLTDWKYMGDFKTEVPIITRAFLCNCELEKRWEDENILTNYPSTIRLPPEKFRASG